jgi:hypothetical protein
MLTFLRDTGRLSPRKARLFAVACCRRIWPLLTDGRSRRAVEVAERYADGAATEEELKAAYDAAPGGWPAANLAGAAAMLYADLAAGFAIQSALQAATAGVRKALARTRAVAAKGLCGLLRDLFAPLTSPAVAIAPSVLLWESGTVVCIAQAVHDERDFSPQRLGVLADALVEAGCADKEVLRHCRAQAEHYLGCWCLDLLLGKS